MCAQPVQEHDPDDPVEILRVLPERFREQFLNEYAAAAEAAWSLGATGLFMTCSGCGG